MIPEYAKYSASPWFILSKAHATDILRLESTLHYIECLLFASNNNNYNNNTAVTRKYYFLIKIG